METLIELAIKSLASQSEKTKDSNDALKYTQAILNAANALAVLRSTRTF